MAIKRRMPPYTGYNGRRRDRDRDRDRDRERDRNRDRERSTTGASDPYWRNSPNDIERGQSPTNRKSSNGIPTVSIASTSRSQKSLHTIQRNRQRVEGRVIPSIRKSYEVTRKLSPSHPQLFLDVAAAASAAASISAAQSPTRKSTITSASSKTKSTTSSIGVKKQTSDSGRRSRSDPVPLLNKRNSIKSEQQAKANEYERVPSMPQSSSILKTQSSSGSHKELDSHKELGSQKELGSRRETFVSLPPDQKEDKKDLDEQKLAMCMPNLKLFPCFRGEYPTRHRPGTYQWLQRSGPKGNQMVTMCECENSDPLGTESNIITSCEVTEAHFLSIDCDGDETKMGPTCSPCKDNNSKNIWQSSNQSEAVSSPYLFGYPQSTLNPGSVNMDGFESYDTKMGTSSGIQHQQLQQQLQQQQLHQQQMQQHQQTQCLPNCGNQLPDQSPTLCFSMQQEKRLPTFSNSNNSPNGNGLTEMLAQQLQQQMQQAQAQIAQVQMQLNSACGATRVRKLQVLSHNTMQNDGQDVGESGRTCSEGDDIDMEHDANDDCNNLDDTEYTDVESCACISEQFQHQQQQQQQQLHQQQQQQQQQQQFQQQQPSAPFTQAPFVFPFQYPATATPLTSTPLQFGCYPMPNTMSFQQQDQPRTFQQQDQPRTFALTGCPHQGQQPQQQQPQPPQQQQQQQSLSPQQQPIIQLQQQQQTNLTNTQPSYQSHLQQQSPQNSQQNMCPHGNHFCPSCYRQRYAQMRFMMPRCWPH